MFGLQVACLSCPSGGRALYAFAAVASASLIIAHASVAVLLRASGRRGLIYVPRASGVILRPLVAHMDESPDVDVSETLESVSSSSAQRQEST